MYVGFLSNAHAVDYRYSYDQSKVYYIDYYQYKIHVAPLGHFQNPVPTKRRINRFFDEGYFE